jgi:hypothetical protein
MQPLTVPAQRPAPRARKTTPHRPGDAR